MKQFEVRIDSKNHAEYLALLKSKQIIFTPNPEILLEARRNKKYRDALRVGTLMLPDGNGLLLVSTLLQIPWRFLRIFLYPVLSIVFVLWKKPFKKVIPEIVHGSDFMANVIEWAAQEKKSVFFLGAQKGVALKVAEHFKKRFPQLKVSGTSHSNPSLEALQAVKKAKPDVLFVAYGAPKQELWVAQYKNQLKDIQIVMTVGGAFDFWSGHVKRAPRVFRLFGLEWLWRLVLQPKTRFKRIWNAVIAYPIISFFES